MLMYFNLQRTSVCVFGDEVSVGVARQNATSRHLLVTQVNLTSDSDFDAFATAIDVYVDLSITSTGSRYSVLRALATGTPALYPNTGLLAPYICLACFPYQPGHWTLPVNVMLDIYQQKQFDVSHSVSASRFAASVLNEDTVLPLARRILLSLRSHDNHGDS